MEISFGLRIHGTTVIILCGVRFGPVEPVSHPTLFVTVAATGLMPDKWSCRTIGRISLDIPVSSGNESWLMILFKKISVD